MEPGQSSATSSTPKTLIPRLLPRQPVFHRLPSTITREKGKRNCLWGSSTSSHQGELFETASLRNSPDNTPNMSTFCWSLVVFFFLFFGFSC